MESTRPIRALMRGLDALTVLNLRDGATVSEVAHEIRLPRTTVYRILETLCNAGFVFRDAADDRYRLTIMVRSLSDGFDDEAWVTQIAKPLIEDLGREIVWPVSIATVLGTSLIVRETNSTPARRRAVLRRLPHALARERRRTRLPQLLSRAAARGADRDPRALGQGRGPPRARTAHGSHAAARGNQGAGLRGHRRAPGGWSRRSA